MKALAMLLVLLVVPLPLAAAHPFTERTVPDSAANAPVGTTEVIVYFSEPIDIEFSEMKVFDSGGEQIDNRDAAYHEGELSIISTTPPLTDGTYTVTTKVLSKVDGHLVPGAFVFGVGDAIVTSGDLPQKGAELVFLPEAAARFPALVGQTIVLGAAISSIVVWGTQDKRPIRAGLGIVSAFHHGRFMSLTGVGLVLVFISGIMMMAIQTVRLEASPIDVVQTYFGTVWLARMAMTIALLGIWFWMDRAGALSGKNLVPMLAVSLALISTTTMIGHGAASGEAGAIILDYIHNLVAAVWIGGIAYFVFALLPALGRLQDDSKERMSLAMVPRFSIAFVVSVGVVIVTGPTLMWFLESDVGLITGSLFGQLIMLKIGIASCMVGLGGYMQICVQKRAEAALGSGKARVHRRLGRSLKLDAALGIALLGVVALLTNGTLPAGEIQRADAAGVRYGFEGMEFSENARFDVGIVPFAAGVNAITVSVSGLDGNRLPDSEQVRVKVSNPSRNISPIEVPMERVGGGGGPAEFAGEVTFGFNGRWLVQVEALRAENPNESRMLDLLVKPRLSDIRMDVTEYDLPKDSKPLYPLYDGDGSLWVSDASAPRVWEFSLDTLEFTEHAFDGVGSTFLTIDGDGDVWFVDGVRNQIGVIDSQTSEITTRTIPKLDPTISENTPLAIQADLDGDVWVAVINKDKVVRYMPGSGEFDEVALPDRGSLPFALAIDGEGRVWYTASGTGKIGYIEPDGGIVTEVQSDIILAGPEALMFGEDGELWVSEHTGMAITRYDPVLGTFGRVAVPYPESLPFGMAADRYGNIWFAQHVIDSIGVYDPHAGSMAEVPIPTQTSFVQFLESDGDGNVWYVAQEAGKIGMIQMAEVPAPAMQGVSGGAELRYSEVASPLIALGILASSLFYVKAVNDKRRIGGLV